MITTDQDLTAIKIDQLDKINQNYLISYYFAPVHQNIQQKYADIESLFKKYLCLTWNSRKTKFIYYYMFLGLELVEAQTSPVVKEVLLSSF